MSLSNYPPGVTGSEPQIAGYPPCGKCGHEADSHLARNGETTPCDECECDEYDQYGDDWLDAARERRDEERNTDA